MNRDRRQSGFTLIELLVVIGIIALVVALALPSLRGARGNAEQVRCLANIRSTGLSFQQYLAVNRGLYPFARAEQLFPLAPPDEEPTDFISTGDPWSLSYIWPVAFHASAPWREHYRTWVNPGRDQDPATPWKDTTGRFLWPSFHYSNAFVAAPEVWIPGAELNPDRAIRAVNESELQFPSSKALLFSSDLAYLRRPVRADEPRPVLAADGSAAARKDSAANPPGQNRMSGSLQLYLDTAGGIRGRDF